MTDSRACWTTSGAFPASFCAHSRYAVDLFGGDRTKNEEEYSNLGIKTAELGLSMPEPRKGKRSSYRPFARKEQQASSTRQASAT